MEESFEIKKANFLDFANFKDFPKEIKSLTKTEKREILMREIYDYYTREKDMRRKVNWKRYVSWLKTNKIDEKKLGREKTYRQFKTKTIGKPGGYFKDMTLDGLKWLLRHKSVADLPYFISTAKEFYHTGKSFGGWLSNWVERVDK